METQLDQKSYPKPVFAFVGPTNAGKSTLFNRVIDKRLSITAYDESTTRDKIYAIASWQGKVFTVVDTGGFTDNKTNLTKQILDKTQAAISEADIVVYVFDGKADMTAHDSEIVKKLRQQKQVWIAANKVDSYSQEKKTKDYDYLGLPFFKISSISGRGIGDLLDAMAEKSEVTDYQPANADEPLIAIIGRPNVGKSTLLNALAGSERSIVSETAGTTRDPVIDTIDIDNRRYTVADTAGIRRRGKIEVGVEKFSVERAIQIIEQASVVIAVADSTENITRGDLHLIFRAKALKKPVLLVLNKTDLAKSQHQLRYVKEVETVYVSAKEKTNLEAITAWLKANIR